MKISKSKQELARIISENGGWGEFCEWAVQDERGEFGDNSVVLFEGEDKPVIMAGDTEWMCAEGYESDSTFGRHVCNAEKLVKNWRQTILSRTEYFKLCPAPDADGWIEWNGGECPLVRGSVVDIRHRNGQEYIACAALGLWNQTWGRIGENPDDIIAYRPHKPEIAPAAQEPKPMPVPEDRPTIEQLAADYRNLLDFARRKQQEADAAKADAEAKLAELVAAGKEFRLVLSVAAPEPELVITDWRDLLVGDEVDAGYRGIERVVGSVLKIDVRDSDQPILVSDGVKSVWATEFHFIRRP